MIFFESENIYKTKEILKSLDIDDINKSDFIQRDKNGWGISILDYKSEIKDLARVVLFSLPPKTYIAHRHTSDIDYEYCHYILDTNEDCGIIIEDEYLPYYNGLLFSFHYGTMPHIAWNNGSTKRDSLVFIYKKSNVTFEQWLSEKVKVVKGEYVDSALLEKDEIIKMINRFNIKINL